MRNLAIIFCLLLLTHSFGDYSQGTGEIAKQKEIKFGAKDLMFFSEQKMGLCQVVAENIYQATRLTPNSLIMKYFYFRFSILVLTSFLTSWRSCSNGSVWIIIGECSMTFCFSLRLFFVVCKESKVSWNRHFLLDWNGNFA